MNGALESRVFCDDFAAFHRKISHFGMLNSLAQTFIKLAVPGVPDITRNELWEFNLVDPDNRRAVDYERRKDVLAEFEKLCSNGCDQHATFVRELTANMDDGRIKAYLIWKILNLRKQQPELFQLGDYVPLRFQENARSIWSHSLADIKSKLLLCWRRACVHSCWQASCGCLAAKRFGRTCKSNSRACQASTKFIYRGKTCSRARRSLCETSFQPLPGCAADLRIIRGGE